MSENKFYIGLDLGQSQDYTAIAIIEKIGEAPESVYHARHLERVPLGTPYPAIVERVKKLYDNPDLNHPKLIIDKSGVGAAVCDLFSLANIYHERVTIIGGDKEANEGHEWRVPKRDLVSAVKVTLQTDRLKIADKLPEKHIIIQELGAFQVKITDSANDIYAAREGVHDDLVLAVALAVWWAHIKSETEDWFYG